MTSNNQFGKHQGLDHLVAEFQLDQDEKEQKRREYSGYTQGGSNSEHFRHIPADRFFLDLGIVIGNGQDGNIVEQGQYNDHQGRDRVKVKDHDGQGHEQDNTNSLRNSKDGVALHPFKGDSGLLNGVIDNRQPRRGEDDVSRRPGGVGGIGNGKTAVRLFQGRCIIDTVTGHADDMAGFLQAVHQHVLILGHDLGKDIGCFDHLNNGGFMGVEKFLVEQADVIDGLQFLDHGIGKFPGFFTGNIRVQLVIDGGCQGLGQADQFGIGFAAQLSGPHGFIGKTEHGADFAGNGHIIPGDHFHLDPVCLHVADYLSGIITGRINQRNQPDQLQGAVRGHAPGNSQGTVPLGGQQVDGVADGNHFIVRQVRHIKQHLGGTLEDLVTCISLMNSGFGSLDYRVKRNKISLLVEV